MPVSRRQTGWLPAGLMLALRWPFGPRPQDAGLSDTGPVGHWSRSALVALALVAVGSGWCEKPLNQPAAIQRLIECTVQLKPTVPSKNIGHAGCQITALATTAPLFPLACGWVRRMPTRVLPTTLGLTMLPRLAHAAGPETDTAPGPPVNLDFIADHTPAEPSAPIGKITFRRDERETACNKKRSQRKAGTGRRQWGHGRRLSRSKQIRQISAVRIALYGCALRLRGVRRKRGRIRPAQIGFARLK